MKKTIHNIGGFKLVSPAPCEIAYYNYHIEIDFKNKCHFFMNNGKRELLTHALALGFKIHIPFASKTIRNLVISNKIKHSNNET